MRTAKLFQSLLGNRQNTADARFHVAGMSCNGCAERASKSVKTLPGIASAVFDFKTGEANITYRPEAVSIEQIQKQILAAGFSVTTQPKAQ